VAAPRMRLSYPRLWKPQQVPIGPVEIDWSHQLARGLIFANLGTRDLTGNVPALTLTNGSVAQGSTPAGAAWAHTAANQQLWALAPTALKPNQGSLFWYGNVIGNPGVANTGYLGVVPDNAGSAPYDSYAIAADAGTNNFCFFDSGATTDFAAIITGQQTLAASWIGAGGAIVGYRNGVQVGSGATQGASPAYTGTSLVSVGGYPTTYTTRYPNALTNFALIYNVVLPANLMAWLNAEPFAMLRPKVVRQFFLAASSLVALQVPYQPQMQLAPIQAQ